MRSITLSRLQRIGIVLSVLIFLTEFFYFDNEAQKLSDSDIAFHQKILLDRTDSQKEKILKQCFSDSDKSPNSMDVPDTYQYCYKKYATELKDLDDRYDAEINKLITISIKNRHLLDSAINALIPLPIFWLLAYIIIRTYRWIMKGQS